MRLFCSQPYGERIVPQQQPLAISLTNQRQLIYDSKQNSWKPEEIASAPVGLESLSEHQDSVESLLQRNIYNGQGQTDPHILSRIQSLVVVDPWESPEDSATW